MFFQHLILLALLTLSLARVLPIEKRDNKHWWSGLESYSTYHQRYAELGCENKHNTSFFHECCHPRLRDADISQIPDQCLGSNDLCDDDDQDNDNQTSSVPTVSTSISVPVAPSPTTAHHSTPKSTPTSRSGEGPGSSNKADNHLAGSGKGTFFFQNGIAGACGKVHSDASKVVALDSRLYGNSDGPSKYCGKTIHITNTDNGKTVKAIVADSCPTCVSKGSVDMSVGAFTQIATEEQGEVNIKWWIDLE